MKAEEEADGQYKELFGRAWSEEMEDECRIQEGMVSDGERVCKTFKMVRLDDATLKINNCQCKEAKAFVVNCFSHGVN